MKDFQTKILFAYLALVLAGIGVIWCRHYEACGASKSAKDTEPTVASDDANNQDPASKTKELEGRLQFTVGGQTGTFEAKVSVSPVAPSSTNPPSATPSKSKSSVPAKPAASKSSP